MEFRFVFFCASSFSVAAGRVGHSRNQRRASKKTPKSRLTKIRNYGYILSMRNVSVLKDRLRLVKTGQIGPAEKGAETPPNALSEPSPIKVNEGQ
jgi:hypothetical protein